MPEDKHTDLWIIIDEVSLSVIQKYDKDADKMIPATFPSDDSANAYARERLELWNCLRVSFSHRFIAHEPNMSAVFE